LKKITYRYQAILANQSPEQKVFVFKAKAKEILDFSVIDRAGRNERGGMNGFQRPQIASHIANIRDYLATPTAILPNALVIAFLDGLRVRGTRREPAEIEISVGVRKPGLVVDGQQRLTALGQAGREDFEVFVIGLLCSNFNELRKQFILVNSTRPLPKSLIYELLPSVKDISLALSARTQAARLVEQLNFNGNSSLRGAIRTHTNPSGYITDSALHRVIMNSVSDGAIRELGSNGHDAAAFQLLSNFYGAVRAVFADAWENHTPKTSRLVHGTGIAALGYVMEAIYSRRGRSDVDTFRRGLQPLVGKTSWTAGTWKFGRGEVVPWNRLQNVPRDVMTLASYLVAHLKFTADARGKRMLRRRIRRA
jgi:DGQHR domain-containing protein